MLDDHLSAVDAHVGKSIFDSVIGPHGMLKQKTRLFVTNSLSFLPQCDSIIMLDMGTVTEMGNYEETLVKEGPIGDFIRLYLSNNDANREHIKHMNDNNSSTNTTTTATTTTGTGTGTGSSQQQARDSIITSFIVFVCNERSTVFLPTKITCLSFFTN